MVILGIDPGFAILGWGLIEKKGNQLNYLQCGAIVTSKEKTLSERLHELSVQLETLLNTLKPDEIAIEQLYFSTNTKTALDVAHARGVILLSCFKNGIRVAEYGPLTVKQTIAGDGKADKLQVQTMVKRTLKLSTIPKPDDIADALAIAMTHGYTNTMIKPHFSRLSRDSRGTVRK